MIIQLLNFGEAMWSSMLTQNISLPELDAEEIEQFLEHPMVKSALCTNGVDLEEYTNSIRNRLLQSESESIQEYLKDRSSFVTLYEDLTDCDKILSGMEVMLGDFQEQLSSATTQIREMQTLSKEYMTKLDNRKKLSDLITKFLNDIYIPDNLVRTINHGKINKVYVQWLELFDQKVETIEELGPSVLCVREQKEFIINNMNTACTKVHAWLQHKMCVHEKRNLQSLKRRQVALKKYSYLFKFLRKRDQVRAKDIVSGYTIMTSSIYFTHFQKYGTLIKSAQFDTVTKSALLAESDTVLRDFFSSKISKNRVNVYSLATRNESLQKLDEPVVFPNLETTEKSAKVKFPYEYLFRCVFYEFMGLVVTESVFCKDFFGHDMSEQVLNKTIAILKNNISDYLSTSYDCLGMIIIQIIMCNYKQQLNSKNVRVIDTYFQEVSDLLKNRFSQVMTSHVESLRGAIPLLVGSIDYRSPHYITRRYAELCTSLLLLKKDHENLLRVFDLDNCLKSLRVEMLSLLERMGSTLSTEKKNSYF